LILNRGAGGSKWTDDRATVEVSCMTRLMDEDHRNGVGVFDPALKGSFLVKVQIADDMPGQQRSPRL